MSGEGAARWFVWDSRTDLAQWHAELAFRNWTPDPDCPVERTADGRARVRFIWTGTGEPPNVGPRPADEELVNGRQLR